MAGGLIVISGPSGSGKNTIISELLKIRQDIVHSISCTTRAARPNEKHGVDYYFLAKEEFQNLIRQNGFLEYAQVMDNYYGTSFQELERIQSLGKIPILDIDVQGALQIKQKLKNAIFVFIMPPSLEALRNRLLKRKTESLEQIEKRINLAKKEMEYTPYYDKVIVNDNLEKAVAELNSYLDEKLYGKNS